MGAPAYVPKTPAVKVRSYASPPRRPEPWRSDRPGDLTGRQPEADRLGVPGPDPGYVLTLTERFGDSLQLHAREASADVLAGAATVAMKRAGLIGRAPISADVEMGLLVWGYLDADVDEELVSLRREWFEEVHTRRYYMKLRRVADAVPDELLRSTPEQIKAAYAADWRDCLDLTV